MGVKGLLGQLPGGRSDDLCRGFVDLSDIMRGEHVDIDAGTLLYVCAWRHKQAYAEGNYLPSVAAFQSQLLILETINKWKFTVVFDGCPPTEKQHEHARREQDPTSIRITSDYISMCVQVCKNRCTSYVVAPEEADSQVGRRRDNTIVLCRDSDEVAYGNEFVVVVDSYSREEYRVIDLSHPLTDEVKENYPLYNHYCSFGLRVFHYWAACMGCDITKSSTGLTGIGRVSFLTAMEKFDGSNPSQFTTKALAKELHAAGRPDTRLTYSVKAIEAELNRVSDWFSVGGTYYDEMGNVMSVSGHRVRESSRLTKRHMNGDIDPKSLSVFTADQERKINLVQSHQLHHNSCVDRSKLNGLSLPPGKTIDDCTVDELKRMVIERGGCLQGDGKTLTKPKLRRIVKAYLLMEKQNSRHTVYFDRSRNNNGVFSKIDTGERRTIGQILQTLQHPEPFMMRFFQDVRRYYENGNFEDDFTTIALSAPELKDDCIRKAFAHVGESTTQKSISDGLKQVLQMDEVIYHAMASAEDGKSIYILSKQRASQTHDEATRNKTDHGEKPKLAEYLVLLQVGVEKTTYETHKHDLGICTHLMRAYCGQCKAGCGMCKHKSGALWMQHLHWGEGRPTEQPATSWFCSWIPGCRSARTCTTLKPASHTHIEKLPESNEAAKAKLDRGIKKNMHAGIPARYDVFGGDERLHSMLNDPRYVSKERLATLFKLIRQSNINDSV